jgi:large subunit ribosomal protein L37Ae
VTPVQIRATPFRTESPEHNIKMASKKKKIKAAGRFGAGYGTRLRKSFNAIESKQRKRQISPFYAKGRVKRIAAGIWRCLKTGKIFAGPAYSLESEQ